MDRGDPIGVFDVPQFRGAAGFEPACEQLGAHRAVDEQDAAFVDQFVQDRHANSVPWQLRSRA